MMASQELGQEFFMVIAWRVHTPTENSKRLCSHTSVPRDRERETVSKCQIVGGKILIRSMSMYELKYITTKQ